MLQPITKAERRAGILKKNSAALARIVKDSKGYILNQGCGCYIEDYGVDYVDTKRKIRDSIGVLVPFYSNGKLRRHYGLISEESQKPIVRKIQKTYHINIDVPSEYNRFIRILQELQYAHDEAFDDGKNDMQKFVDACSKLEGSIC
jgi:hypothetical protein